MAITTLSMVLTVFVLNLHHINDRPVPAWLKTFMLHYLARLMCMCQFIPREIPDEQDTEKRNKYRVTPNSLGNAVGNQIGLLASLNGTLGMRNTHASSRSKQTENSRHGENFRSHYTFAEENTRKTKDIKMKEEEWAKDWRHLAEVVDRMFFWLFLSAIVITTLLLFHPLTKTYFSILGDEAILGEKKARSL